MEVGRSVRYLSAMSYAQMFDVVYKSLPRTAPAPFQCVVILSRASIVECFGNGDTPMEACEAAAAAAIKYLFNPRITIHEKN